MLFPHLSEFEPEIIQLLTARAGNNLGASDMQAWIKIISAAEGGIVLESIPADDSFEMRYGNTTKSGAIGRNLFGAAIYVDGDRAFRPSPIIENVSVEFGAGGLNRKCTFDIKAFTLKQAEALSKYFLEPGFTVVVEYGWNTPKSVAYQITPSSYCQMTGFLNYNWLKTRQKNSMYKYDGFLGYITNGGMKSGDDETYILSVELTTIGEIPMYLQQHRGSNTVDATTNNSGKTYSEGDIEDLIEDGKVGKALFYQMFNRLPQAKQTNAVKKLLQDGTIKPEVTHEGNYINMDDVVKKTLLEELKDTDVETESDDGAATIPEGAPLISEHSYIRLGLAFEILNAYTIDLKAKKNACGETGATFSYLIEYKNTICRAHKYIFSTDGSKLMIPNPNTPDFGLLDVLKSSTEIKTSTILKPGVAEPVKVQNLTQFEDTTHAFPQQVNLKSSRYVWPTDAVQFDLPAGTYGFLEDLFINFEFFCEVLGRANMVTKDIYYELLNGISSAVNSAWHFEIQQLPDPKKADTYHLVVVDLSTCGKSEAKPTLFESSGANTPFLSSEFSMDIPGAMKNMIIGKRNSQGKPVDAKSEGDIPFQGLFAKKQDPVLNLLNSFNSPVAVDEPPNDPDDKGSESEEEAKARKKNYELFMSKATVVPKIKDRDSPDMDAAEGAWYDIFNNADANLEDIVNVVAWNDVELFRTLELGHEAAAQANNVLIPIKFTFTTFGVSGIKTGDMFRILDIPTQYKDAVFQVTKVSHDISQELWKTTVEGTMRNIR